MKAFTCEPADAEPMFVARQRSFPTRVESTTFVPRTYATDGVPFAPSASMPS